MQPSSRIFGAGSPGPPRSRCGRLPRPATLFPSWSSRLTPRRYAGSLHGRRPPPKSWVSPHGRHRHAIRPSPSLCSIGSSPQPTCARRNAASMIPSRGTTGGRGSGPATFSMTERLRDGGVPACMGGHIRPPGYVRMCRSMYEGWGPDRSRSQGTDRGSRAPRTEEAGSYPRIAGLPIVFIAPSLPTATEQPVPSASLYRAVADGSRAPEATAFTGASLGGEPRHAGTSRAAICFTSQDQTSPRRRPGRTSNFCGRRMACRMAVTCTAATSWRRTC